MHCFNHTEKEAIGICKSCQRGLCPDCATDLGHGLACAGKHEKDVNTLKTIIDQSAKIYEVTPKTRNAAPFFYGFMGSIFTGYSLLKDNGPAEFPFLLGVGFIVFAVYMYIYNKKAYARKD